MRAPRLDCANQFPPITLPIRNTTPKILGPTILIPLPLLNIHPPIMSAIGIVMPMVNTPHGLWESALTTTMPRPASVTSRMNSTAIIATVPANGPISVLATSASDRPLCRTEATSTVKSCTHPAITAPISNHRNPGANPNCAASVGPTNGPAPAIAAKW